MSNEKATWLSAEARRGVIVSAGVRLVKKTALWNVTYEAVADECLVVTSAATVRYHFPKKMQLWRAIEKAAGDEKVSKQLEEMLK